MTAILRGESLAAVTWTPVTTWSLAYLGFVAGAVGFLIYFELLDRLGAAEINLIGYLEPVAATAISYLLLGRLIDVPRRGLRRYLRGFALIKRAAIRELVDSATGV